MLSAQNVNNFDGLARAAEHFTLPADHAGVSFKPAHFDDIKSSDHSVGWFEIHAENYMMDGGPMRRQLQFLRESYPVSCHGVGLSIGSHEPLDQDHLARVARLVEWLEPAIFSEHLAWSSHGGNFFNDLLPLPYTRQTLERVANHIDEIQERLSRPILLENPSSYVWFSESDMSEAEFLASVVAQTGCALLLDINNVYVSSTNQGLQPADFLDSLPFEAVDQIHLAGHFVDHGPHGEPLLIDSHNAKVSDAVWDLYEQTIFQYGPIPTLIEWDGDLPEFSVLAAEAAQADRRTHSLKPKVRYVAG